MGKVISIAEKVKNVDPIDAYIRERMTKAATRSLENFKKNQAKKQQQICK